MRSLAGAATERTALAWQRSGLSVAASAALLARLTYDELGGWALLALAPTLALAGWVLVDSRVRYRRRVITVATRRGVGGWAAALATCVVLMSVTELAALLL